MVFHNLKSKDIYDEIYDRITGEQVNIATKRVTDNIYYASFNLPPNENRHYKLNLININKDINNPILSTTTPNTVFMEYNINNAIINNGYFIN